MRPPGHPRVEDVEIVGLLLGIKRRGQGVDDRLAQPVRRRKHEHPHVEAPVRGLLSEGIEGRCRRKCDDRREQVQHERQYQEGLVAHAVGDQARGEDHQAKADEPASRDRAELELGEPELVAPFPEDAPADGKPTPAAMSVMKLARKIRRPGICSVIGASSLFRPELLHLRPREVDVEGKSGHQFSRTARARESR